MSVFANTPIEADAGSTAPRSLSRQFALAGSLVMLVVMTFAGLLASKIVTSSAVENTATSTALFMDSFLSPHLQALAQGDALPPDKVAALDRLMEGETKSEVTFANRFPHLEIWKEGGLIVYSKAHELVGRRFPTPTGLVEALSGHVSARYADLSAQEHVARHFESKYLEIYVPVREHLTGRIIAVAEIHERPELLGQRLLKLRLRIWLVSGTLTLAVMLSLFGIVHRGSRLIGAQHAALRQRINEIRKVSDQNRSLIDKAQHASSRLSELNAIYLRSVGAELHDGPAQLIGLAALKVEHVRRAETSVSRLRELQAMDSILSEALQDIRGISKGLMLPEIENLPLRDVVLRAVKLHEKRTETNVSVICDSLDCDVSHAVKICVYRFVQEGLSNAYRHATPSGHSLTCSLRDSLLTVAVQDQGDPTDNEYGTIEAGLGLTGLRARVESLGGTFAAEFIPTGGMRVEMTLSLLGDA